MGDSNSCAEFIERLFWLIKLRWIAVAGVLLTILLSSLGFKFFLPLASLYTLSVSLAICNLVYIILIKRFGPACRMLESAQTDNDKSFKAVNWIINIQISFDLFILIALIHFSGGIENPFLFYSIFHMIIASIFLSRKESFLQATFATVLFGVMVASEYSGVLPHYCLKSFMAVDIHKNLTYIGSISFVFVTTLYIAVYMTTSISARLRQREKILMEANTLLNEKDRSKSEYVLRVSHDIKEDLAAIQSCLEPVEGGITGELNPKQLDLVQRAVHRTTKLLFFVKALLEATRIKLSKEIKMEHFSFKDMVSEVVGQISLKAKEKNIPITAFVEPTIGKVRGAEEYLRETIANLLANSVKYTPRNGKIDISVSDKGNRILIKITDNGIGIPKEELPKIFEEFYRASNAKEVERDGTGLGLSIAKQVIEKHNGKIWVESEEGRGSTFYILLPK